MTKIVDIKMELKVPDWDVDFEKDLAAFLKSEGIMNDVKITKKQGAVMSYEMAEEHNLAELERIRLELETMKNNGETE